MMAWGIAPPHTCLPRLMRDSAQERCATKPAFSHLRRSSHLSQTSCCSYPRPDAVSDLPHVFPRLQASWLLSRSCLLDDSALELVHEFEDIAQYRIRQFVGRTCLRFFGNGLRGMGNMFERLGAATHESLQLTPRDALPLRVGHNTSLDIARTDPFHHVNVWCDGWSTDGAQTALDVCSK